jgi:long-chain acyl-CoA synthetase
MSDPDTRACTEDAVTSAVIEERAYIEAQTAGMTFCRLLQRTVAEHGDEPAYSDRDSDAPWQTLTWRQFRDQVLRLAAALVRLGLQPGDRVALMLPNRMEHVLADQAVLHAGGVPVTFYATLASDQIRYVASDCQVRMAVLDGASELARWEPLLAELPSLTTVIVRDAEVCPADDRHLHWGAFAALGEEASSGREAAEVARRADAVGSADPVTMLYTSGTTANPKGVVITHGSVMYECKTAELGGNTMQGVRWVSYLPLAHIAERMFTLYLAAYSAGHTYFCHVPTDLIGVVGQVRPTAFFGVPRVWEKIQAGIQALLTMEQDETKKAAVAAAMETGREYVRSCQYGHTTSADLAARFGAAEEQVLRPIKGLLGLDQAASVISAAAPLPPEVAAFFAGLGMKILDVYGMTETTGAFTTNTPTAFKIGTVGRPVPGVEVKIAEDGEILTRGPLNTPG